MAPGPEQTCSFNRYLDSLGQARCPAGETTASVLRGSHEDIIPKKDSTCLKWHTAFLPELWKVHVLFPISVPSGQVPFHHLAPMFKCTASDPLS